MLKIIMATKNYFDNSKDNSDKIVFSQTNDLMLLLQTLLDNNTQNVEEYRNSTRTELADLYRELEIERLRHQETKDLLADESQKLHILDSQLHVLQRQLSREQTTFERAFGMLRSNELVNASPQKMATHIAGLRADCQQKEEELKQKDCMIEKLHKTIKSMKEERQRELDNFKIETKHKNYLTKKVASTQRKKL